MHLLCDTDLFHEKAGTSARQTISGPGYTEVLAWTAPADDVHRGQLRPVQLGDISHMDHAGEVLFGHLDGELLDLAGPDWGDAVAYRRQRKTADPVK